MSSPPACSLRGYGCHRNLIWDESLRMPRNPFAGKPNREMTYIKEVPLSTLLGCSQLIPTINNLLPKLKSLRSLSGQNSLDSKSVVLHSFAHTPATNDIQRTISMMMVLHCSRPRRLAQWDMQRTMRGASTPRKNFTPMLPASLQQTGEIDMNIGY